MNILPCWKTPAKPLSIRYWLILPQTVDLCSPLQSERNVSFSSCLFLTNLHSLRWNTAGIRKTGLLFSMIWHWKFCSLPSRSRKKCLSAKNDLCTFWWRKKSASDLLWSKYVSSRNQPEAVSSQKHSAVQAESYLPEMRAESACFQGCGAFISCLAVVIFLNPRHGFLCTHLPYPCTVLPI